MKRRLFLKNQYITKNTKETRSLGSFFAKEVLKMVPQKNSIILALEGELGAGKTTFIQGLGRGFGVKEKIQSPTFVILKRYNVEKQKANQRFFFHIDCYRINSPREILGLGFKEITSLPQNIVAIEWADKISAVLPQKSLKFIFRAIEKDTREINLLNKKWKKKKS